MMSSVRMRVTNVCLLIAGVAAILADGKPTEFQTPLCELLRYGHCQSYSSPCTNIKWGISYCPAGLTCCQDRPKPKPIKPTATVDKCRSVLRGTCMVNDITRCARSLSISGSSYYCPNNPSHVCCLELRNEIKPSVVPPPTIKPSVGNAECGVPVKPAGTWRVVGGTKAKHGAWPWQVSLKVIGDTHYCGGSIINNQWILTAAHCFLQYDSPFEFMVRVGQNTRHIEKGSEVDHYVDKIITHEKYEGYDYKDSHDIALMKLSKPITYNDYAKPICLSTKYDEFDSHQDCWVTGWGETKGTEDDRYLQQLQSAMVSNKDCNSNFWLGDVKEGMTCFGFGLKGACMGDSGGPLVCRKKNIFYQVGIVSWGTTTCRELGASSVFTRVAHYLPWIKKTMALYS